MKTRGDSKTKHWQINRCNNKSKDLSHGPWLFGRKMGSTGSSRQGDVSQESIERPDMKFVNESLFHG